MSRRSAQSKQLPKRMHFKHGAYYHVSTSSPRKWTRLGDDLGTALKAWANIEAQALPRDQTIFKFVAALYEKQEVTRLSIRTQSDYKKHLKLLNLVFQDVHLEDIKPTDVYQYLEARGRSSKVQANREKAVLSALFNFARRLGIVDCSNPCVGVRGHSESSRKRYVSDEEFNELYRASPWWIQDVLDVSLLTGQRPADVFKLDVQDVHSDCIFVEQNKTGAKLRIELVDDLQVACERILARDRVGSQLLVNRRGEALTYNQFRFEFDKVREALGVDWQLRDLRAKTATDLNNLGSAQRLLGHRSRSTTEIYTRNRKGELVKPLSRGEAA